MEPQRTEHVPEWLSKLEVARRQLAAAIRLFFEQRDPIAVHTLVAAGHQVLADLGDTKGIVSLLKGGKRRAEHVRDLNFAANFFKHADRDPDGRINVAPLAELTAEFLMDAVVMLQRLAGELPMEAKVYWAWFVTKHRELFEDAGPAIEGMIELGIDPHDFSSIADLLRFHEIAGEAALDEE